MDNGQLIINNYLFFALKFLSKDGETKKIFLDINPRTKAREVIVRGNCQR